MVLRSRRANAGPTARRATMQCVLRNMDDMTPPPPAPPALGPTPCRQPPLQRLHEPPACSNTPAPCHCWLPVPRRLQPPHACSRFKLQAYQSRDVTAPLLALLAPEGEEASDPHAYRTLPKPQRPGIRLRAA